MKQPVFGEFGIDVGVPVEHPDDEIEVVMMFRRHILHQQIPRHRAAFHHGLEHAEHVGIHLRLIGHQRPGRVQNAGVDLPAGARLQLVGFRVIEDAVVALVPALQALPYTSSFVVPGSRPMKV